MSDATGVIRKTVDLNAGIEPTHVGRLFAVGDSKAHTFRITVTADGFPKNMANYTIKGFFLKPDQQNSIVLNGRVDPSDPSTVEVDLIEACYDNAGLFQILIRATNGSVTSTIFWGHGKVTKVIDDDHQETVEALPSYSELLAQIQQLNNTLGSSDALNIIYSLAKPYSNQQTYKVGEFVTYQYQLYQCIEPVTVAETFDRSKWTAVAVTDAIAPPIKTSVQSDDIATFQNEVKDQAAQVTVALEPIQAGSGDPSPENVRAISGHTECLIVACGENYIPQTYQGETIYGVTASDIENGAITLSGKNTGTTAAGFYFVTESQLIPYESGVSYRFYCLPRTRQGTSSTYRARIRLYAPSQTVGEGFYKTVYNYGRSVTVDPSDNVPDEVVSSGYFKFDMTLLVYKGIGVDGLVCKPVLTKLGNGDPSHLVTFPDPPGTVYGGTLTVNRDGTGKLLVDRGYYAFDGSEEWDALASAENLYFLNAQSYSNFADVYLNATANDFAVSNRYMQRTYGGVVNAQNGQFAIGSPSATSINRRIYVKDTACATVDDFKASLATTPMQLVYRINTPITYDLTSEQVGKIILSEGPNNIWSSGQVTVNYIVDTKTYIDSKDELIRQELQNGIDELEAKDSQLETYIENLTEESRSKDTELDISKASVINKAVEQASIATFDDGAKDSPMAVTVTLDLIQAGSGDPAPDNVRAISGHSSVGIMTAGKNLLPGDYYNGDHYTVNGITFTVSDGKIVANGTATATAQYNILSRTANSFILPNGRYRLRGSPAGGGSTTWELGVSVTSAGGGTNTIGRDYRNNGEFDYTQSMGRISTYAIIRSGQTVENFTFEPMLTLVADADEPYEKPACATKTITFPDQPGTVYGGTLTVNQDGTGKLVVDKQFVDAATKRWTMSSAVQGRFILTLTSTVNDLPRTDVENKYCICSHYRFSTTVNTTLTNIVYVNSSSQICIQTNSEDTLETFTAYLEAQSEAGAPVTLCYRLETPITYDLTAEQVGQIKSIKGLNNIWSVGPVTVTYAADTKTYVDDVAEDVEEIKTTIADYSTVKSKANAALAGGTIIRESVGFPWDSGGVLGYNYTCKIPLGGSISGHAVFVSVIAAANNNLGSLINALAPFYKVDAEGGYVYLYANTNQYKPTRVKVVII